MPVVSGRTQSYIIYCGIFWLELACAWKVWGSWVPLPPCLRALRPPSTLEGSVGWLLLTWLSWIPYAFSSACLVAPPSSGTIPHAHLLLLIYQVHISEKYFSVIAKTVFKQGNIALDQAPQWGEKAKNGVKEEKYRRVKKAKWRPGEGGKYKNIWDKPAFHKKW